MKIKVGSASVAVERGDITDWDVDAIVNAANSTLVMGTGVAADVRVATDHLVGESLEQLGHRELAAFGGDLRVEHHLEEEVAELLAQRLEAARLDRLQHLVGFLDEVGLERRPRLLSIPWASIRPTQAVHDVQEPLEESTGRLGHVVPGGRAIIQQGFARVLGSQPSWPPTSRTRGSRSPIDGGAPTTMRRRPRGLFARRRRRLAACARSRRRE